MSYNDVNPMLEPRVQAFLAELFSEIGHIISPDSINYVTVDGIPRVFIRWYHTEVNVFKTKQTGHVTVEITLDCDVIDIYEFSYFSSRKPATATATREYLKNYLNLVITRDVMEA